MTNAERNRQEAIGMLMELYFPTSQDHAPQFNESRNDKIAIAENIMKLSQLGKTERWISAIRRWRNMVLDEKCSIDWALKQGCIYASHAS
jgi:hypothetical protein